MGDHQVKKAAPKAATPAVVSAFIAQMDTELERLRGLLVERGTYADQFRTLADKATQSVADAKADIAELERLRALVSSGQAQPDTGGTVSVRSIQSD